MKFKLFAIIAVAAITIVSCDWFNSKSTNTNELTGTWRLDSIKPGNDTAQIGILLLAMAMENDSINYTITKDSIYSANETPLAYSYNKETSEILLKDSVNTNFKIHSLNDSLLHLSANDSSAYYFKRVAVKK